MIKLFTFGGNNISDLDGLVLAADGARQAAGEYHSKELKK